MDNIGGTSDGDKGDVVSVVSANFGAFTKAKEYSNVQTGAATGATVSVWYLLCSNDPGTTTVTLNGTVTAKGFIAPAFTLASGSTIAIQDSIPLANDNANPGSMTLSGLPSREYLFVRGIGYENADVACTPTSGWTSPAGSLGTSGGSNTTNAGVTCEIKIATATSATSAPTLVSCDNASVLIAFYEVVASSSQKPFSYGYVIQ